jgi:hypothetical protein
MAVLALFPVSISSSGVAADFKEGFGTGLAGGVAIMAFITIFLYKNRRRQIRICYALLLIQVLIYALYFIFERNYLPLSDFFQHIRFTFVFPLITIVLLFLAIRGIKKDEKLIRSLDRLR